MRCNVSLESILEYCSPDHLLKDATTYCTKLFLYNEKMFVSVIAMCQEYQIISRR
jgi:hypothetical protein